MKSLTVDIYRIVFRVTKIKLFAYAFALIYMSTLNFIVIHGLGLLMEGWIEYFAIVHMLYAFPFSIVTALGIAAATYALMPSLSNITKASKREGNPLVLVLYSFFAIGLFVFMRVILAV